MKQIVHHSERGFTLIIGMAILILLTVLGITVVQTVSSDIDASISDKGSQSALEIAEAGLTWALDYLQRNYNLNTANAQTFQNIITNTNNDFVAFASATAEEKLCCPTADACSGTWQIMTQSRTTAEKSFGGGHYDVIVGLDPADPQNQTLLVRSLGVDARGSQRLIEIAVAAGQ